MAIVVCVGAAFLDYAFAVERVPATPTKCFATDHSIGGGGMAATAAVAITRLGGEAWFWGRLGTDAVGDEIARGLEAEDVRLDDVRRVANARSPATAALVDRDGERMLCAFPGAGLDADAGWLPLDKLEGVNAVLVDPRWPEAARAVLQAAHDRKLPAVLDGEVGPEGLDPALVSLASHVVFSSAGLEQFTGESDREHGLHAAAERSHALVVGVTAGADGFYWIDDEAVRHLPALKIDAVDTLGAGDVFHGAYALALAEDKGPEEAGCMATVAAGLKCARPGGRAAIPDRAELWHVIDNGMLM